ncbi:MAG: TIGR04282 family arsenosugar biosynthesis glycosyltransferase [Nitrospinae bacterium]|nr:TIGR04282 family arsenosugar biosynthesis glycosyltransferase [Nitrospinota bacterium]
MNSTALAILAKCPIPGKAKTRLQPRISPEDSARLQEALILDTVFKARDIPGIDAFIGCPPSDGKSFFKDLQKKTGIGTFLQKGETLGEKIQNVFREKFGQGYEKVAVIGVDSPTFPPEFLTEAALALDESDAVVGPTVDGGYYLVGMKGNFKPILPDGDMGHERVLQEALDRCERLGLKTSTLPPWYDLDAFPDLEFAATHIRLLKLAGKYHPRRTGKLLERIFSNLKSEI